IIFPSLDDDWTHWWIEGDDNFIAVIEGSMLKKAVDIVVEHFDDFISIMVYLAKKDFNGQIIPNKNRRWEVAHNWDLERGIEDDQTDPNRIKGSD
ncbi:MAG: hypothetical protein JW944_03125, partial [Deltaproteobacteria bacterium]|nr:hypothetical protein [Deltaproteobacteria bacterium]